MSAHTYELESLLARGSVAEVYRGRSSAGEGVVVKVLRREHRAEPAQRLLLLEEGELLRSLAHPNLVRCLDVVDELPALVLEAVDGATLEKLLDTPSASGGRLPLGQVLGIARDLAAALAYLHGRGIAHLGLLPQNVLLSQSGRVVLIDFGHGAWSGRRVVIHRAPSTENLPYACPELWAGEALGPPADVYRLGVLLCHLLAGRPPKLAGRARRGRPHPGLMPVARMLPTLAVEVTALLARLVAREPTARPTADAALVAELTALHERFA